MHDANPQLVEYIQTHLTNGYSEDSIRKVLLQYGWSAEHTELAFAAVQSAATANHQTYPTPIEAQSEQPHSGQLSEQPQTTNAPRKYRVFISLKDAYNAAKYNVTTYVLSLVAGYVCAILSFILLGKILNVFPANPYAFSLASLIFLIGCSIIFNAISTSLIMTWPAMALASGADRVKGPITEVVRDSLPLLPRMILANILYTIVVFWPVAVVIFLALVALNSFGLGSLTLLSLVILGGFVWIFIALLRLALVPYVALFEPELPMSEVFSRSSYLLRSGGQWFLIKGLGLLVIISIIASVVMGKSLRELAETNNILLILSFLIIDIITFASLLMLYRNRRQIRG